MNDLKIEIFETFSEQLKKHWLEFEKKSDHHFFQTLKWQKLWFEHQKLKNKSITNYSIIVTELDEIIMIAPFNIDYSGGIKKLKWSGFPFSDYNCPLLRTGKKISREQFKNIWKLILNNSNKDFDCVILKNQPENILNNKNPFFYLRGQKIFNKYFGIKLNKNFKFEKKEQTNIDYQINRLNRYGEISFKLVENTEDLKKILQFIIEHKSKQYDKTGAWNLFKKNLYRDLFISSGLELKESVYVTYLTFNKKIIAAHFGYIYNKMCYYLFPVYDYDFNKYSPGKILLKMIIDDCISNSIDYFDFTIGLENYKKKLSNYENKASFYFKSYNLRGLSLIVFLECKELIKSIIRCFK